MIDFIICDENSYIVSQVNEIVNNVCRKCQVKSNIYKFYDFSKELACYIKNNKKRVVYILDIELPTESGITIAKMVRKNDKNSIIIFLSSHNELAYNIIRDRLNILTFVSKTYDYKEELSRAVKQSLDYVKPSDIIAFNDTKLDYCISAQDILYLTKDDRKTSIITDKKTFNVYKSISSMEELLPACFVRTHRACIVNADRVESFNNAKKIITFDNGMQIDLVSDKYKRDLSHECRN